MSTRRHWPDTRSRWWSLCVLAVLSIAFVVLVELAYLLVHGQWMPWR